MAHSYSSSASPLSPLLPSPIKGEPRFSQKLLWGGFIVGLVMTSMIGVILFVFIKRRFFGPIKQRQERKYILQSGTLNLRRFQFEELEKATKNFSPEYLVGSGAFGNVYKGTFDEGVLAIKRAHADSYDSVEEFRNGNRRQKVLVYEYVPNGSLLEYIVGRRGKTLTWRQRVNIAIGAAKGISHLHEGIKPSIIHRDIKPSNILVGDGFEAKVSDFGLVKSGPVGDESHVSSQIKGTPGYLDPAYCSSFHLSPFSDVYSFGVILLQLVAARPAVDSSRNQSEYHIVEWARPSLESGKVEDVLDANLLLEPCNMEMMLKMGQLGLRCVVKVPRQRPTMSQVWQQLEEALHSTETLIHKQPSQSSRRFSDQEFSQSFASTDGIRLQRFHVEMDSLSFQSASLRCLENNSISIDIDKHELGGINEDTEHEGSLSHK
ncbi:putative serine/threonine-protein kinase PBL9 [Tasmannia lanceolata]|uniref:putative serine/threonine-protein kinase PBL9 n=1 Tax=Tasmannia lanceolata TaxID=3420 RepID=UPI004064282D